MGDAGVGEAAAVEGAKGAGEAAGAAGAADIGGGALAADAGAGALGATAADVGGGALATGFGGVGTDAAVAGLGTGALDASAPAALGGLGGAATGFGGVGTDAGVAAFAPGAADAGAFVFNPAVDSQAASSALGITGADGASMAGMDFLPVTSGGSSLTPDLASMLGISAPDAGGVPAGAAGGMADFGGTGVDPSVLGTGAGGGGGFMSSLSEGADSVWNWAKAHPAQAGMLGLSGFNATHQPQLPGAARTASGAAGSEVQNAQAILNSGGTSSPMWQTMKGSIDSSINQNLQQAIEQMAQAAANSGQGGKDSAVVQQKIAQLTAQAESQRQQLYTQALGQIVSQAVSELSGGNQVLTNIAGMQLSQSQEARQLAAETAALALELGGGKGP